MATVLPDDGVVVIRFDSLFDVGAAARVVAASGFRVADIRGRLTYAWLDETTVLGHASNSELSIDALKGPMWFYPSSAERFGQGRASVDRNYYTFKVPRKLLLLGASFHGWPMHHLNGFPELTWSIKKDCDLLELLFANRAKEEFKKERGYAAATPAGGDVGTVRAAENLFGAYGFDGMTEGEEIILFNPKDALVEMKKHTGKVESGNVKGFTQEQVDELGRPLSEQEGVAFGKRLSEDGLLGPHFQKATAAP